MACIGHLHDYFIEAELGRGYSQSDPMVNGMDVREVSLACGEEHGLSYTYLVIFRRLDPHKLTLLPTLRFRFLE